MHYITAEAQPAAGDLAVVHHGLWAFNAAATGGQGIRPFAAFLRDGAGKVAGGASGFSLWGWMHLGDLWVEESLRGRGQGSLLLARFEDEARLRKCLGVLLDTFSFQARPFYEKRGYVVFAELSDCPPGGSRYYMRKLLSGGSVE